MRRAFAPLFTRTGVNLVCSGHDHDYQRSVPIDGVTYVVSGGATRARLTGTRSFTAAAFKLQHFLDIAVFEDRLIVRAVTAKGHVADEVILPPVVRGS
ncbi:MAG: hypothetical protein ACT4OX_01630 [Actinomycetota bacterium]